MMMAVSANGRRYLLLVQTSAVADVLIIIAEVTASKVEIETAKSDIVGGQGCKMARWQRGKEGVNRATPVGHQGN